MDIPDEVLAEAVAPLDVIEEYNILPEKIGKTYIQRLAHVYGILWSNKYGMKPMIAYGQIGKVAKQYMDLGFNEYQIAYLMVMYFDWAGADGDDEFTSNRLGNATHSIFLMKPLVDSMRAYSKNVLKVDVDNLEEIKLIVDKILI